MSRSSKSPNKRHHEHGWKRKRAQYDDPDFEWHRQDNLYNEDTLTTTCSLEQLNKIDNKKKQAKQSLESEESFNNDVTKAYRNESGSETSKLWDTARDMVRSHRKLVVASNIHTEESPVSCRDRQFHTKINSSYPEYKLESPISNYDCPRTFRKIPPYITPSRRPGGVLHNRFLSFSSNSSEAEVKPCYRNYQLLGDSQLLRFSEKILYLKALVFHGEDSKRRYNGYCVSGQKIKDLEDSLLKNEHKLSKNVILLIGTNDFLKNNDYNSMCTSYASILQHLKEHTENIVILTVPPIPKFGKQGVYWFKFRKFNEYIMQLNKRPKIFVLDLATAFIGYDNETLDDYFEQYYDNNIKRPDLVHLNIRGFSLLKSLLDIHYFSS